MVEYIQKGKDIIIGAAVASKKVGKGAAKIGEVVFMKIKGDKK